MNIGQEDTREQTSMLLLWISYFDNSDIQVRFPAWREEQKNYLFIGSERAATNIFRIVSSIVYLAAMA